MYRLSSRLDADASHSAQLLPERLHELPSGQEITDWMTHCTPVQAYPPGI